MPISVDSNILQIFIVKKLKLYPITTKKKEKGAYYEAPKSLDMASPRGIEPLLPG
ncbi:uncharacterized protein METZ01_LOCUS211339 [marine metagenome]|uniref:Uncharacterized protein n=1 Tax=marine metagenome TaxID=408172 RepID=A0A382F729_9ZZZZ